jgi:hypothetical protein
VFAAALHVPSGDYRKERLTVTGRLLLCKLKPF